MRVQFRFKTKDGVVWQGAVKGNGGFLGDGSQHVGPEAAMRRAVADLDRERRRAWADRALTIFEPQPGCIAVVEKDDQVRIVRLRDIATIELVNAPVMWVSWQRHSPSADGTLDASLRSGRNTSKGHAVCYPWDGESWNWPALHALCGSRVPAGDDADAQVFNLNDDVPHAQRCKRCLKKLGGTQ